MAIKAFSFGAGIALVLALGGCQRTQTPDSFSGSTEVDEVRVASRYGGRVEKTLAQEGVRHRAVPGTRTRALHAASIYTLPHCNGMALGLDYLVRRKWGDLSEAAATKPPGEQM